MTILNYLFKALTGIRLYERVITASNYQEASQALQDAGYATDPTYAQKIIQVIEAYHLDQYDRR